MTTLSYSIAGLSLRGIYAFAYPLLGKATGGDANDFRAMARIVGIVEPDVARARRFCELVGMDFPIFPPEEFDRMLTETKPDRVLVTGPDFTHHRYITDTLSSGRDVITEKPMVITSEQARDVLTVERASGRRVFMAHNYRYMPLMQTLKTLLDSGRVGRVTNIEFTYNLDTSHGASYFFRWNRERAKSGGLNIHKCCHHFDLMNWLLGDHPETVCAFGRLNYYGPNGAKRPRGEDGQPLPPAEEKARCPYFRRNFAANFQPDSNEISNAWDEFRIPYEVQYPSNQRRYIYDDVIDIEDTYGAIMEYRGGAILSYSCNFSTPWEGFTIGINGTAGRIEVSDHTNPDPTGRDSAAPSATPIIIYPLFGGREEVVVYGSKGGHGGADAIMQRDLFAGQSEESRRLGLMATSYQGAMAVCQGEAVHRSLTSKTFIRIRDLLGEHYRA